MKGRRHTDHTLDKSSWGDGPWLTEPDLLQWIDLKTGLYCAIKRNGVRAFCGYVGVEKSHPDYGKDYNDINYDAHGGLTYAKEVQAGILNPLDIKNAPVYVPFKTTDPKELWIFGFDCAHLGDLCPGLAKSFYFTDTDIYRELGYVKLEVETLAIQLIGKDPMQNLLNRIKKEIGL